MAAVGAKRTFTFNIQMGGDSGSGQRSTRPGSSRPYSARLADKEHQQTMQRGSHMFNRSKSGLVSYEDLLVAQYLDELRREKSEVRTEKELPPSPYLQRLPHANLLHGKMARSYKAQHRHRPFSASMASANRRDSKPKIDAKFIADENLWDPATPRDTLPQKYSRPASAPIKRSRPISGLSVGSMRNRRFRPGSATKSVFKRQPRTITVCAFKNGTRDTFIHASAPTLKILLEMVTEKLGLGFAARRIFLEDGIEVFDSSDIPAHADVYISTGENYKDPFRPMKQNMIVRQGAKWSLKGIILPEDRRKRSRHRMSKRLKNLSQINTMRIIIYKNGKSAEPHEVVVEPHKFDEFLQACTGRLELRKHAKKAYDWEGNEITDLEDTPVLDDRLQSKGGQVRGPLWISTGEGFSPLGTLEFLMNIKQVIRQKLKNTQFYQKEINAALNDEPVEIPSVKAMSSDQLYFALEESEAEIKQLKEALSLLNKKLEPLKEKAVMEEEMGPKYRMSHIQEIEAEHRLVGPKGLRLKVYENGLDEGEFDYYFNLREATRGVTKENKEKLLQRLLDELSYTTKAASCPQPRLAAVAQCLYDKFGKKITNVMSLIPKKDDRGEKEDTKVWVSYGEPFISPFTYCLDVVYDRAIKATSIQGTEHVLRDSVVDPDLLALINTHSKWEASIGFPVVADAGGYEGEAKQAECDVLKDSQEVDGRSTFLVHKEDYNLTMYPELVINEKPRRGHPESQIWIISKSGYIYNKGMPQLCLGVSDMRVEGKLFTRDTPVQGFAISLQKRMTGNPNQIWRFAANGTISAESNPQLVLTYLGNKFGDDESYSENKPQGLLSGMRVYLILADPLSKKDAACQRFALKQERFDNLGQWKYTDAANPEWNKQALSWPVKQDGELNEKYDWPMEGFLLAFAPPLSVTRKGAGSSVLPARLMVVRNGEGSTAGAVPVVGPNLTTMMKEKRERKTDKGKKNRKQEKAETEMDELNIHCMDYSVQELEFTMFLDSCTMILQLPSAARRLFDEHGEEHFTLQSLKRDQTVFVSCGEGWSDPKLTHDEQQRRLLLSKLSSDVSKIRQYVSQRNPEDFVLEVDVNLSPGARLVLGKQWKQSDESPPSHADTESLLRRSVEQQQQEEEETEDTSGMTAHERAHYLSEQRQNALKWPWERVVNVATSLDASDFEAQKYSDPQLYEKFKPKPSPRAPRDMLQRFVYEDSYIACSANRNLVLAASVHEGRNSEVILAKRVPDDISQRWAIHSNGEIRSRFNQKLVLTVSFPTDLIVRGESQPQPLAGCAIMLQSRRVNLFGHAHQRWRYDAETGFITAFNTDLPDKEITAANMSDVCTFAIAGPVEIDQPGYKAEIVKRKGVKKLMVCLSCARAMRGRYKLESLAPNTPFACAMGEAKKHRLPTMGSFRVLNGKVDLSTHEAEITLHHWEEQLESLRQQTTFNIYNEINAARTVTTVKVMAYKNGEGRMRPGEIICGSTVEGILSQCTVRLGLNTSARRLYAEGGELLLDIDDIVNYAIDLYRNALADKMEALLDKDGQSGDEKPQADNREEEQRLEQLRQSVTQEVDVAVSQALANVQLFAEEGEDSERGQGEEADERAANTPRQVEDGNGDMMEEDKIARRREELLSQVELPPLETILRYPIEVWVSSGKNFVPPEVVESKEENRRKKRALRAQVCLELDLEKHCLRQMRGRRFKNQRPGVYRPTLSAKQPVVLEGHWQEATVEEQDKHQSVNKLQNHLGEIQANLKRERSNVLGINLTGALYRQPVMKRIQVFPNGESPEHAVMVWGESMTELLDNSTLKLGLWKKAKCFFTEEGKRIEMLDDIQPEQMLCVSTGKPFIKPQCVRTAVEVRANWGRARKQYGPQATDIGVNIKKNPKVDVDPFGPPELALPLTDGKDQALESTA